VITISLQNERELIGAIIKKPELIDTIMQEIDPRDLGDFACNKIYELMLELVSTSVNIRTGEIMARLKGAGVLQEMGGEQQIRTLLTDNIGMPSLIPHYLQRIKSAALRRRMKLMADELKEMAVQEEMTDAECLTRMNEMQNRLSSKPKSNIKDISTIYSDYLNRIDSKEPSKSPTVGISDVDGRIGGIGCNRLITVAGRPGGGKTTFVVQALHNIGLQGVGPTILFTMEMDDEEILEKMISDHFSIGYGTVQERAFTDEQKQRLKTDDRVKKSRMYIDSTPFIDIDHFVRVCRTMKRRHGELGAIGLDYLGLMNKHKAKGETTTEAIGRITSTLKQLARELQCSIFMLSQMNREIEKNKGGTPTMSDLRESGNIEQDSDMVIFLHKKPDEEQTDQRYTKIEMIIAKGRKTGTAKIDLNFSGNLQRISSASVIHT
jgi:replicative DNA helicase